jgi:GNAT superfamily N-acetyltransferase
MDEDDPVDVIVLADRRFMVERARAADVPALVGLLTDDPLGADRETSDLSAYERAFVAIDQDPQQFLAAVRDPDGALVGTMQLTLIPGLSRGATTRLQIEAVRVAESARGTGLGSAMFEWAHDYGRAHGAGLVQLTTDKTRGDAHRFYARLGYDATHEGLKLAL